MFTNLLQPKPPFFRVGQKSRDIWKKPGLVSFTDFLRVLQCAYAFLRVKSWENSFFQELPVFSRQNHRQPCFRGKDL